MIYVLSTYAKKKDKKAAQLHDYQPMPFGLQFFKHELLKLWIKKWSNLFLKRKQGKVIWVF